MQTIVIYHSADYDGLFCREIARKFLPHAALIGWDYGQPVPVLPDECLLYMLDISIEELMNHPTLVWIDHHKSAMDKYGVKCGYQIDGVAACRLAWQWFVSSPNNNRSTNFATRGVGETLPDKRHFVDRLIEEPLAVRLAGEYDIWDRRDARAELFQHGLRSQELGENMWDLLLSGPTAEVDGKQGAAEITVDALLESGRAIQYAKTQENAGIITSYGFTLKFEGFTFLACNHARFNSHLFTAGIKPEHDALLGFNYDGVKCKWRVSLYHAPGKEHHDLSLIAVKHGGGGHKGACGFLKENVWELLNNP